MAISSKNNNFIIAISSKLHLFHYFIENSFTNLLVKSNYHSGFKAGEFTVRVGSQKYNDGGSIEDVENFYIHDDFDYGAIDYDYSLLKLNKSLSFTDTVKAIALPEVDEEDVPDDTMAIVSGWGNTQNSTESRIKLRAAKVPIVNQESCIAKYQSLGEVTPRMICAGYEEGGKDCRSYMPLYFFHFS